MAARDGFLPAQRDECDTCGAWVIRAKWAGLKVTGERFGLTFKQAHVFHGFGYDVLRLYSSSRGWTLEPWDAHDARSFLTLPHECKRSLWRGMLMADFARIHYERRAAVPITKRVSALEGCPF